jgi:ABC-2 type transport system permease protein
VRRVRKIIARRRILGLLISRDLKVKYAGSALGYFWTILEPLLMCVTYWFVFSVIIKRGAGVADEPYVIFLLVALLPYQWAASVISSTPRSFSAEAKLVRSTDLPREIWVLRTVGSKFIEFVFSIPVLVAFLLVAHKGVNWHVLYVPLALGMQWVALVGIGLILAPATVIMADLERIIKIIVRIFFYLCPVLYSVNAVLESHRIPGIVKLLYSFNPFASILSLYRSAIFPDQTPSWEMILRGSVSCMVLLVAGALVFRRLERAVLKEI